MLTDTTSICFIPQRSSSIPDEDASEAEPAAVNLPVNAGADRKGKRKAEEEISPPPNTRSQSFVAPTAPPLPPKNPDRGMK